jgi:hypothetical protein
MTYFDYRIMTLLALSHQTGQNIKLIGFKVRKYTPNTSTYNSFRSTIFCFLYLCVFLKGMTNDSLFLTNVIFILTNGGELTERTACIWLIYALPCLPPPPPPRVT